MVGSSGLKAIRKNKDLIRNFKKFKNQWVAETGCLWPSKCSTNGCNKTPTVGAHAFIHGKEHMYLYCPYVPEMQYSDKTKNLDVDEQNIVEMVERYPAWLLN